MPPPRLDRALADWRDALGPDSVVIGDALARAQRGLAPSADLAAALLRPARVEQVRAALDVAAAHDIALHPISRGLNWGYGAARPPRADAVVISLERMDRVRALDEDLAWVELEPGVSFEQLDAVLRGCERAFLPVRTGGPAAGSVVGNALARGLGEGLGVARVRDLLGLELVRPSGALVRLPDAGPVGRWALGPDLRGLFQQSSLAVVTAATLALTPAPAWVEHVQLRLVDDAALARFVEALRAPLQSPASALAVRAVDDRGQLMALAQTGEGPISPAERRARARAWGGARWVVTGTIHAESRAALDDAGDRLEQLMVPGAERLRRLGPQPGRALLDAPIRDGLQLAWSAKPAPRRPGASPLDDRCGLLWTAPTLPHRGAAFAELSALTESIAAEHRLDVSASLRFVDGRVAIAVLAAVWDRDRDGADARALAWREAMRAALDARGWPPYRLGVGDRPPSRAAELDALLAELATTLDPQALLARGPYDAR